LSKVKKILGVNFFTGDMPALLKVTAGGGLIVVPSAPVLADLSSDLAHCEAVQKSDVAIVDSGLLVLIWLAAKGRKLERISGLKFIRGLLELPAFCVAGETFWVMPSQADMTSNLKWLRANGCAVPDENTYLAPVYPKKGHLEDEELLASIERLKPPFVILNLGGGVQERLGYYLRENLSYKPAIICTGAAIAFLSGQQVAVPGWADKAMLGWLLRCLSSPKKFVPRYWRARRLVAMVLKHGADSPAQRGHGKAASAAARRVR
jgi:N-acetylglucosaminyldiphosphoundecaprenol N-acetyl-beta-D-mannosaminyltransferase